MSDEDKGYLLAFTLVGVVGCLFGAGYALNEGYATSKVVGHGMTGFAAGVCALIFLLVVART